MKFLIINGPNLNLLGQREPGIYGEENYTALCGRLRAFASAHQSTAECFQSNTREPSLTPFMPRRATMTLSS